MNWLKKFHEDGSHYWEITIPGLGEMCVDLQVGNPVWIASAFWFGCDIEIERAEDDYAAKGWAEVWLRQKVCAMENALVQGCNRADDGE